MNMRPEYANAMETLPPKLIMHMEVLGDVRLSVWFC